jgi:hypothetical protein
MNFKWALSRSRLGRFLNSLEAGSKADKPSRAKIHIDAKSTVAVVEFSRDGSRVRLRRSHKANNAFSRSDRPIVRSRRAGDPAALMADVGRIRSTLDWCPQFENLDTIHAPAWEQLLSRRKRRR